MVSHARHSKPGSRERLLRAAADEFSARGFDGAKVDRIARRARVNKAMLYYHFDNKAALYREILGTLFSRLATEVAQVREAGGPADEQIRRYIRTVAAVTVAVPHFPAIWLREMAEGGRHLDADIAASIAAVLKTLGAMLEEGRTSGLFRRAHPLVTQMGIVAPLILFAASEPARERFQKTVPENVVMVPREAVVAHVEATTLAALRAESHVIESPTRRPS